MDAINILRELVRHWKRDPSYHDEPSCGLRHPRRQGISPERCYYCEANLFIKQYDSQPKSSYFKETMSSRDGE